MKFLIWAVIVFLVLAWVMRAKQAAHQADASKSGTRPAAGKHKAEAMLPCRYCGTHIPASEAVAHGSGAVFCSDDHLRRAASVT